MATANTVISTWLALLMLFSAAFQVNSSPYYVLYVCVATGVRHLSRDAPLSASAVSIQAYSLSAWAIYMLVVWALILLRQRTNSPLVDGSATASDWSWRSTFVEAYMQSGLVASCSAGGPFLMGAFVLGRAWGQERRKERKEGLVEEGRYEGDDRLKNYEKGLEAPVSTSQKKMRVDGQADEKAILTGNVHEACQ